MEPKETNPHISLEMRVWSPDAEQKEQEGRGTTDLVGQLQCMLGHGLMAAYRTCW